MKEISVDELQEHILAGHLDATTELIDVRTPYEYLRGHIAGSRNVPINTLEDYAKDCADKTTIYVVCLSGSRSEMATYILESLGISGTPINVSGGLIAWNAAGLPMVQ